MEEQKISFCNIVVLRLHCEKIILSFNIGKFVYAMMQSR